MDWDKAIARNRAALEAIAASLFALLGLGETAIADRIPQYLHRHVLRLLVPAESALRRLIVIAARGLVMKPLPHRTMPKGLALPRKARSSTSFRLVDPRKRLAPRQRADFGPRLEPRIHAFGFGGDPRVPLFRHDHSAAPGDAPTLPLGPDGLISALGLYRRLQALRAALADVPRQARRLVRWRARREQPAQAKFTSPLRPGHPPGYRRNPVHEADRVLAECHGLARDLLAANTS